MPTASQYARYRADRTTIWVSKAAAAFLSRERETPRESAGSVLDRLLRELRRNRRAEGDAPATRPAAKKAATRGRKSAGRKAASKRRG